MTDPFVSVDEAWVTLALIDNRERMVVGRGATLDESYEEVRRHWMFSHPDGDQCPVRWQLLYGEVGAYGDCDSISSAIHGIYTAWQALAACNVAVLMGMPISIVSDGSFSLQIPGYERVRRQVNEFGSQAHEASTPMGLDPTLN